MLVTFWRFLVRRWQRADTIRRLQWLDDHLLTDIGTTRDAIPDFIIGLELEQAMLAEQRGPLERAQLATIDAQACAHGKRAASYGDDPSATQQDARRFTAG